MKCECYDNLDQPKLRARAREYEILYEETSLLLVYDKVTLIVHAKRKAKGQQQPKPQS